MTARVRLIGGVLAALLLTACTGGGLREPVTVENGRLIKPILELRERQAANPDDASVRARLLTLEARAAEHYYERGRRRMASGDFAAAVTEFRKGLIARPSNGKLQDGLREAMRRRQARTLIGEARRNREAGKHGAARRLVEQALELAPDNRNARALADELAAGDESGPTEAVPLLDSDERIDLEFHETGLRRAFQFLAKTFEINVLFDPEVEDESVTLYGRDLAFREALELLMAATDTFYKRIGAGTLLIAPDTDEKRGQYEDYSIQSFHLRAGDAKQMASLLQSVLAVDNVTVNEGDNSLIVRDSDRRLELVRNVIAANDRKPAEVVLEVEILEVNHTRTDQLGFDFGERISASFDDFPIDSSWSDALQNGTVTLPDIAFRYFKQDVDADILANPKIRVLDSKSAKIHIGDSVPLRSSTILDATGQTRTTFEYRDVGVRLAVQPKIHLDNSVTVKMSLEVSSLGQNLGTPEEPAFSIGTRNADTHMLLRDGETVILGGLIRDEERRRRVQVPGLGEIPAVGALFRSKNDEDARTDVLLAMTPRVVRPKEIPPPELRHMYSGTENFYTADAPYATLSSGATARIGPRATDTGGTGAPVADAEDDFAGGTPEATVPADDTGAGGGEPATGPTADVRFQRRAYAVAPEKTITATVTGAGDGPIEATISYDPDVLEVTGAQVLAEGATAEVAEPGRVRIRGRTDGNGPEDLVDLSIHGRRPGVSYLMIDLGAGTAENPAERDATAPPTVSAARVVVE